MIIRPLPVEQAYAMRRDEILLFASGASLGGIPYPDFSWPRYLSLEAKCKKENIFMIGPTAFTEWMLGEMEEDYE